MDTKRMLAVLTTTALLVWASTAMAQNQGRAPNNALIGGQAALSFGVPSGGNPYYRDASGLDGLLNGNLNSAALGYHYMFTDSFRGGLNLGFSLVSYDNSTPFSLDIAPQMNYYFANTDGTVAPFIYGQVALAIYSDGNDQTDDDPRFSLRGGLGVEWFPVTRFSISGQVGLNLDLVNATVNGAGGQQGGDPDFGINLFTSALAANIYF